MFNLFKLLFGHNRPLLDRIADHVGIDTLSIWNGISRDDPSKYMIPMSGRKHYDWSNPNFQWLMIGFGSYIGGPIIEIWINRNLEIVRCQRNRSNNPKYNAKTSFERKIDKFYDQLCDERKFKTENPRIAEWVDSLFTMPTKFLYRSCIQFDGFTTTTYGVLDHLRKQCVDAGYDVLCS